MCCLYLRPPCVCRSLTQSPVPTSLQRGKSAAAVSSRMQHLRPRMLKSEALLTPQTRVKAPRPKMSRQQVADQNYAAEMAAAVCYKDPLFPGASQNSGGRKPGRGRLESLMSSDSRACLHSRNSDKPDEVSVLGLFCPRPAEQSRTQGTRPNSTEKDPRKDMNSEQTSPAAGST